MSKQCGNKGINFLENVESTNDGKNLGFISCRFIHFTTKYSLLTSVFMLQSFYLIFIFRSIFEFFYFHFKFMILSKYIFQFGISFMMNEVDFVLFFKDQSKAKIREQFHKPAERAVLIYEM